MIELLGVTKNYGSDTILSGVSLRINKDERIGIVGKNGAGKTTLIRILAGEDEDFSGTIKKTDQETIGYVRQHFPVADETALDFMIKPFLCTREELARLEETMACASGKELERALAAWGELRSQYDSVSGEDAEGRAIAFLEGIDLDYCAYTPLASLSGGERNILALGRALLYRPDVLILDEPGNHLDIQGLAWLENFIREYPGAVVVISHNRYLLDRVATKIVALEEGLTTSYAGNYSAYRIERLRNAVSGERAFRADEKKIAQLEETVKKFAEIARRVADPAWGRRLRARRTHLEKTKESAREKPVNPVSSFSVSFTTEPSKADIALKVTNLSCGFEGRQLFTDAAFTIRTGERVALVGENGSGKSTLIKDILRRSAEGDRSAYIGPSMVVGYCSQHGEGLHPEATVFDECARMGSRTEDEAGKTLSRFLFTRDVLSRTTGTLSGGERNRLQLALAVIARANFLILDEPTNHLDIPSCEAIEDALIDFSGTILVVSHDRYFLDRVASRVIEIDKGCLTSWDGNFSEFWFSRYGTTPDRPIHTTTRKPESNIEQRIISMERERKTIEADMERAFTHGKLDEARSLGGKLARASREIDRLYSLWN